MTPRGYLHRSNRPDRPAWCFSSAEITPGERDWRAGAHAGTGWNAGLREKARPLRQKPVGNDWTIMLLSRRNARARLVSDGHSKFKRTGRTLPTPRQTSRSLHRKRLLDLALEYEAADCGAGAAAVNGVAHFAKGGIVTVSY